MANLSNINNKFIVTDGGNVLIGGNISGSSILQVTGTSTFTTSSTVLSLNRTGGATALIELKIGGTVEGYLGATSTKSFVVFNESAAEKFSVSNGGNGVFTGTVTTSDVYGTSSLRVAALGGILYLDSGSGASTIMRTNGTTTALTIDSSGRTSIIGVFESSTNQGILNLNQSSGNGSLGMGFHDTSSNPHFWLQSRSKDSYSTSYALSLNPNGGNVGIGTPLPSAKLSINAGAQFINFSGRDTIVQAANDPTNANIYTTQAGVGDFGQLSGSLVLQARTQGTVYRDIIFAGGLGTVASPATQLMTILGEGRVGIGRPSPGAKLDIKGTGGATGLTFRTTDASNNEIFYIMDGGRVGVRYYPFSIGLPSTTSTATGSRFQVATTAGDFVVLNDGKVGIGTTSPLKILTVKKATSTTDIGTSEVMRLAGTAQAVGNRNELGFANYDFDYNASVVIGVEIMSTLGYLKQDLYFATRESTTDVAPTERMRIKSDGNVDIITPITNGFFGLSLKYSAIEVAVFKVNNATGQVDIGGNAVGYFPTLASGGIERIRITTAGDVLISKTILNPSVEGIELRESGQLNVASTVDQFNFYNTSAGVYRFFVTAAGAVHATSTSINAISDLSLIHI